MEFPLPKGEGTITNGAKGQFVTVYGIATEAFAENAWKYPGNVGLCHFLILG